MRPSPCEIGLRRAPIPVSGAGRADAAARQISGKGPHSGARSTDCLLLPGRISKVASSRHVP